MLHTSDLSEVRPNRLKRTNSPCKTTGANAGSPRRTAAVAVTVAPALIVPVAATVLGDIGSLPVISASFDDFDVAKCGDPRPTVQRRFIGASRFRGSEAWPR